MELSPVEVPCSSSCEGLVTGSHLPRVVSSPFCSYYLALGILWQRLDGLLVEGDGPLDLKSLKDLVLIVPQAGQDHTTGTAISQPNKLVHQFLVCYLSNKLEHLTAPELSSRSSHLQAHP